MLLSYFYDYGTDNMVASLLCTQSFVLTPTAVQKHNLGARFGKLSFCRMPSFRKSIF